MRARHVTAEAALPDRASATRLSLVVTIPDFHFSITPLLQDNNHFVITGYFIAIIHCFIARVLVTFAM